MFGLWSGTAESAAVKMSIFTGLVTASVCLIGGLVPYFLLRRKKTIFRAIVAYVAGFVTAFALMAGTVLYAEEIEKVPPLVTGHLFGATWAVLIGPLIGIWWAKRTREKLASSQ